MFRIAKKKKKKLQYCYSTIVNLQWYCNSILKQNNNFLFSPINICHFLSPPFSVSHLFLRPSISDSPSLNLWFSLSFQSSLTPSLHTQNPHSHRTMAWPIVTNRGDWSKDRCLGVVWRLTLGYGIAMGFVWVCSRLHRFLLVVVGVSFI